MCVTQGYDSISFHFYKAATFDGFTLNGFLPISVWKIGQQSIGVGVGDVVGDVVLKTLDRKNSRAPRSNDPGQGPTQDGLARHHLIYFWRLKSIGLDRMIMQSRMKE